MPRKKKMKFGPKTKIDIMRVTDGDTFVCRIGKWPPIIGLDISVRIAHIDCPEMRTKNPDIKRKALKARAMLQGILTNALDIELRNIYRGKYFRLIADVNIDGENLAGMLVNRGVARWYDGGTRKPWA